MDDPEHNPDLIKLQDPLEGGEEDNEEEILSYLGLCFGKETKYM